MKRVHIVGCPRSGTTLLMELISTCFASDDFCEHEMSIFEAVPRAAGLYISKQPSDIKHIRQVFFADPELFIIYLTRDPRAVVTSKHRENPEQYFCNYRIWKDCENSAETYCDHPRFLALRYEDLVAEPDQCQTEINKQFGFLQQKHLFSEFEQFASPSTQAARAMNGLRSVNTESLKRWHQHLPRLKEQIANNTKLSEDIKRLGYEKDDQWLKILTPVQATKFPCRYPDRAPFFKELEKKLRIWLKSRRYRQKIEK